MVLSGASQSSSDEMPRTSPAGGVPRTPSRHLADPTQIPHHPRLLAVLVALPVPPFTLLRATVSFCQLWRHGFLYAERSDRRAAVPNLALSRQLLPTGSVYHRMHNPASGNMNTETKKTHFYW